MPELGIWEPVQCWQPGAASLVCYRTAVPRQQLRGTKRYSYTARNCKLKAVPHQKYVRAVLIYGRQPDPNRTPSDRAVSAAAFMTVTMPCASRDGPAKCCG